MIRTENPLPHQHQPASTLDHVWLQPGTTKEKEAQEHPGRRCFSNPPPQNQGKMSNFCRGTAVRDNNRYHTNSVADDELVPEEFGRLPESSSLTGLSTM